MKAQIDGQWVDVAVPTGFRMDVDAIVLEPDDVRKLVNMGERSRIAWLMQLLARFPSERGYTDGPLVGRLGGEETPGDQLLAAVSVLMDSVDYQRGACSSIERVGAVLPVETLELVREAQDAYRLAAAAMHVPERLRGKRRDDDGAA